MDKETFISCVAWIHRGYAAHVPLEAQMDPHEIQALKGDQMIMEEMQSNQMDEEAMEEQQMNGDDYNIPMFSQNIPSANSAKYPNAIDDFEDDEKEDYYIQPTDALIVTGKVEKDQPSLEVYIYEQEKNNLFVHHEIMLSAYPLAIEWLNCSLDSIRGMSGGGAAKLEKGNFAILGTFLPEIEIWNLDQADAVEPDLILGGEAVSNKRKPKKFTNQAKKWKEGSHTDSVLTLSLNDHHKNILASGSADCSMKVWDLSKGKNIHTSNHHKGRVQKVKWSPSDYSVLFSTSVDGTVGVLDSRFPNDTLYHKIKNPKETIESACWNPNQTSQIAYVTDMGNLSLIDVRTMDKPLYTIPVHNGHTVTDVKIGSKNVCYTCSEDETVRVWNLGDFANELVTLAPLAHKKPNCGKMYCLDLYETADGPILSVGNGRGELFVWDVTENENFNNYWQSAR